MAHNFSKMVERPLVIFSRNTCCMCDTVKALFNGFGACSTIYELDHIPNGTEVEEELERRGYGSTVPLVFIGGQHVGGVCEVMSLHFDGSLVPMLIEAGALAFWREQPPPRSAPPPCPPPPCPPPRPRRPRTP